MLEAYDKKFRIPSSSSALIALKPRQVLLAEQQLKLSCGRTMANKQQKKTNPALIHSIISYLQKNGFSKTLKRFCKEAEIENDDRKESTFDLEDIFSTYLENSRNLETKFKGHAEQEQSADGTVGKDADGPFAVEEETISKGKKNKKSEENIENAVATSEADKYAKSAVVSDGNGKVTTTGKSSKEKKAKKLSDSVGQSEQVDQAVCDLKAYQSTKKQKDKNKKKSKSAFESLEVNEKESDLKKTEAVEVKDADGLRGSEETAKSKDKKDKKKLKSGSLVEDGHETKRKMIDDSDATDIPLKACKAESKGKKRKKEVLVSEKPSDNAMEVVDKAKSLENGTKKESRKRKLSASDESENKPVEQLATGQSKRRKTDGSEEAKVGAQQGKSNSMLGGDGHVGGESNEQNGHVNQTEPQKSSIKQVDESILGDLIKNGDDRSTKPNSARKQQNGAAEPKTVNAFQRVKVDEVEFVDERLQNNSYWAKHGAEYGYGAKAQEVLGQVKGRGFRHEKTKKKRGSYRGGVIDQQSHSIKFNYSEEEE